MGSRLAPIVFLLAFAPVAFADDDVRVIVGFNGKPDAATFTKHGGTVKTLNEAAGIVAGNIRCGAVSALRREPNVRYVEHDRVVRASGRVLAQTTPWGVLHVAFPWTWAYSDGSYVDGEGNTVRVRVAVLDTGVETTHEDLVGQVVWGNNFTTDPDGDGDGHGTHVSGTIAAADNSLGVVGAAPGALVVGVKVLGNDGTGFSSWVINGITWASDPAQGNCKVLNMSLGSDFFNSSEETAVNAAWANGAVIVCAAGNDRNSSPDYPGGYANSIAVAGTDWSASSNTDVRYFWSNHGDWVDISAPGDGVPSTYIGNSYATASGTSMASPHVAGAAALVWAKFPTQTNAYVRNRLEAHKGPPIGSSKTIPGIVKPYRSVVSPP